MPEDGASETLIVNRESFFPWDVDGDNDVTGQDIFAVIGHFGDSKPLPWTGRSRMVRLRAWRWRQVTRVSALVTDSAWVSPLESPDGATENTDLHPLQWCWNSWPPRLGSLCRASQPPQI